MLFCAGVGLLAAITSAYGVVMAFDRGDPIGEMFFGAWAIFMGTISAFLGLCCIVRGEA